MDSRWEQGKRGWAKRSLWEDDGTSQCRMAMRRRLKSPPHSESRASFRVTSYFSRYMSFTVCRSSCWSGGENMLALKHKSHATAWSVLRLRPSFSWPRPLSSGSAPWHSVSSALVDNDTHLLGLGDQAHLVLVSSSAHSSWFPLWSSVPVGSSLSNNKPDFLNTYLFFFSWTQSHLQFTSLASSLTLLPGLIHSLISPGLPSEVKCCLSVKVHSRLFGFLSQQLLRLGLCLFQ